MIPAEVLDVYVDWMRKRAVGTLVMEGLQIHLGQLQEPDATKPKPQPEKKRTPEEQAQIDQFGALPRRIERSKP